MIQRRQTGMTILEVLLVLAVATSLVVLGLRMYQTWSQELAARKVLANVDQLFDALALYYGVNCNGSFAGGMNLPQPGIYNPQYGYTNNGTLNPRNPVTPPDLTRSLKLDITNDLVANGFLTNWQPQNSLVDATANQKGYYIELIPMTSDTITVNACSDMSTTPCTLSHTPVPETNVQGYYIPPNRMKGLVWMAAVTVRFRTVTLAQTYQKVLNANCIAVSPGTGNGIDPCKPPVPATSRDVAWLRLPSVKSPDSQTVNWVSVPAQKLLLQQYTHDQMFEMMPASRDDQGNQLRYYLCGG